MSSKKEEEKEEITEEEILIFKRCFNRKSIEQYKLYGPSNPNIRGEICEESHNGICHMMTCQCLECDIDLISTGPWFIGKCMECDETIENKSKAWRIPHKNGGFIGCYCSKEHVKFRFYESDEIDIHFSLIKIMDAIIEKYPIYCINEKKSGVEIEEEM
jgi:hypothetical protein